MVIKYLAGRLKFKLYSFVFLAFLLVFALVSAGAHYYGNIEKANDAKADFNSLVKRLQDTRVAEKTYLQFFTGELKERFAEFARNTETGFSDVAEKSDAVEVKKHIASARNLFNKYTKLFDVQAALHEDHVRLKTEMSQPLSQALQLLTDIQTEMNKRQSELQMQGDDLTTTESEMMNVTRDCRIDFLELQNIQHQFLTTGNMELVDAFKALSDGAVKQDTMSLLEFAKTLNKKDFIANAQNVLQSVTEFLKFIEQSQVLGIKEREAVKEMDAVGKNAIEPVEAVVKLTNKIIDSQKKSAISIIISIIVVGIVAFLALSVVIVGIITKPLNQVVAGLKDIAEGEGDLTNRLKVKSQDEMGELAKWFNVFIEKVQALIRDMATHAADLQTSSHELLGIARSLANGAEQTTGKANTVASAGEEMSVNMNTVASAMAEAASNVNMVASAVE